MHGIVQITIINNSNLNCEDVADVLQNFYNVNNLYEFIYNFVLWYFFF